MSLHRARRVDGGKHPPVGPRAADERFRHSRLRADARGAPLKKFRKTVDGKTLVVVAEINGKDCWL